MNFGVLIRVFLSIVTLGSFLYAYIAKQNEITELRLEIPVASKQLEEIQQENIRLKFEIEKLENPSSLLEWARFPEYRHLKYPLLKDVIQVRVK